MAKPYGKIVASCPKCSAPISDAYPDLWCSNCGERLPPDILAQLPKVAASQAAGIRHFRGSPLSGWFIFFAVLDFLAAAVGLLMAFGGSASEGGAGVTLFAVGISSAFLFLALAKVLDYLGEAVFRLRNLEELATPKA